MSSDDFGAFRAELLRQRVIFEAELRRQRETADARFEAIAHELAEREADCRNLQSVVTMLGKKVDSLAEPRSSTMRFSTPTRGESVDHSTFENRRTRVSSAEKRPSSHPSLIPSSVVLNRIPSVTRRTHSPRIYSEVASGSLRLPVRGTTSR